MVFKIKFSLFLTCGTVLCNVYLSVKGLIGCSTVFQPVDPRQQLMLVHTMKTFFSDLF
jgi:hypothetical protein